MTMHTARAKDLQPADPARSKDWVAIILAVGLVISLLIITVAIFIDAINHNNLTLGIGENATQVLTAIFGGIIGILGSYVGSAAYRQGQTSERSRTIRVEQTDGADDPDLPPPPEF